MPKGGHGETEHGLAVPVLDVLAQPQAGRAPGQHREASRQRIFRSTCELPHAGAAKNMRGLNRQCSSRQRGHCSAQRIHRTRHRGRAWPGLVSRRDDQVGSTAQRGNQLRRDIARPSTVGQGENPRQGFRDAGRSGVGMRSVARRFHVSLGTVKQACTAPRSNAVTTKDLG